MTIWSKMVFANAHFLPIYALVVIFFNWNLLVLYSLFLKSCVLKVIMLQSVSQFNYCIPSQIVQKIHESDAISGQKIRWLLTLVPQSELSVNDTKIKKMISRQFLKPSSFIGFSFKIFAYWDRVRSTWQFCPQKIIKSGFGVVLVQN